MKKIVFASFVSLVMAACGGGGPKVSPEMDAFMKKLDGKSESVAAAIKEFGVEGLNDADMSMYMLKNPEVTAVNGNCYTMDAGSGVTTRTYDLCWENGKIKSVADKGMK